MADEPQIPIGELPPSVNGAVNGHSNGDRPVHGVPSLGDLMMTPNTPPAGWNLAKELLTASDDPAELRARTRITEAEIRARVRLALTLADVETGWPDVESALTLQDQLRISLAGMGRKEALEAYGLQARQERGGGMFGFLNRMVRAEGGNGKMQQGS